MFSKNEESLSFKITDVLDILKKNQKNYVSYFDSNGKFIKKSFAEVYVDVNTTLAVIDRIVGNFEVPPSVVIMGTQSYYWLLIALSCIAQGGEIIALPESLNAKEMQESLGSLAIDYVATTPECLDRVKSISKPVICMTMLEEELKEKLLPLNFKKHNKFSLVAFTSGSSSSSKTKSFRIDPDSIEDFIDSFYRIFDFNRDTNWTICQPFSHIVNLEYALGGLYKGYNITITNSLQVLLHSHKIQPSCLVMVPSMYEQLLLRIRHSLPKKGIRRKIIDLQQKLPVRKYIVTLIAKIQPVIFPELSTILGKKLKVLIIGAGPSSSDLKRELMLYGLPLFEGYGLSETNMISCNTPSHLRFGTAGRVWPGVELRESETTGTLQVRLEKSRTSAYLNVPDYENEEVFFKDGWIETGDLINTDDDGFISIIGRSKDVIITNKGKNINPTSIEERLKAITKAKYAFIFGHGKPFIVAILIADPNEILNEEYIKEKIQTLNLELPYHERIYNFKLIDDFILSSPKYVTTSGKLRRKNIEMVLDEDVKALYEH